MTSAYSVIFMRVEKNVYEYLRPCSHYIGYLLRLHENHTGWPPLTHKSGDFGSISETEGSCAAPAILKVQLHRSDRFLQLFAEVKVRERGLEPITYIQTYMLLPVREHRPAKLNLSFFPMEMVKKFSSITI